MNHRVATVICSLTLLIGLAACAQQPSTAAYDQPGFLYGLFHGFTIFFGLIASIFIDIRIYAFPNTGFWYDTGYAIGVLLAGFSILLVIPS